VKDNFCGSHNGRDANGSPAHTTASAALRGTRTQETTTAGRPRTNWRSTVNKDFDKRCGSAGRKQRWQLLTDTRGWRQCGSMCPRGWWVKT